MTKSEIIELTAYKTGLTRVRSDTAVNAIFDSMVEAFMSGRRIEIHGFGSFVNRDYNGHEGRYPRTGGSTTVEKKRLPYFRVGKELKELVSKTPTIE